MLAVEAINAYLPDRRAEFAGAVGGIRRATGFSQELLFRKYLRYLLDQRLFDGDAVADVVALKTGCRLTDEQVLGAAPPVYHHGRLACAAELRPRCLRRSVN